MAALLVMVLLAGGCSGRSKPASEAAPPDVDGAWMDGATVTVAQDTGRETVTLTDPVSGFQQVMDEEPLTPDVNESGDDT